MWALILVLNAGAAVYSWRTVRRGASYLAYVELAQQRWAELCAVDRESEAQALDIVDLVQLAGHMRVNTWVAATALGVNAGLVLCALWRLQRGL